MSKLFSIQMVDAFKPVTDGVVSTVIQYAEGLSQEAHPTLVIAPAKKGHIDDEPYPVIRFPSVPLLKSNYDLALPPSVSSDRITDILNAPIDLIHVHSPFPVGEMGLSMARRKGVPIIGTFHSKYKDDFKSLIKFERLAKLGVDLLTRQFWNNLDYMFVPTEYAGGILDEYGFTGDWIVMPNGTDMKVINDSEYEKARLGCPLNQKLDGNPFVFMYVGQHRWVKNLRRILDAHVILRDKGVHCVQVMIGGGLDADDIRDEVAKRGLEDRFHFTGVIQDRKLLGQYYARSDVFTFPSLYDTDGLVVKEAAAYRTPSIVVRNTGAAESLKDGENGFLVDDTPESLATVMESLVAHLEKARDAGMAASTSVYRPWGEVVEKLMDTYNLLTEDFRDRAFKRIWAISKAED